MTLAANYANKSKKVHATTHIAHAHTTREWTFINHGAFGGALLPLSVEAHAWRVRFFVCVL